jgi:uncharacterized protein
VTGARTPRAKQRRPGGQEAPLGERDIQAVQTLLDAVPAPLEPLDVSAVDGFLCGVLVQPTAIAAARWLPFVTDVEGRPLPDGFDARPLHALVRRRAAELRRAIERRAWFDPWIFALDDEPEPGARSAADGDGGDGEEDEAVGEDGREDQSAGEPGDAAALAAVLPWAAGFTTALETFPALLGSDDDALVAPLALVYRHLGTETLEDADALVEAIETLEPPADLAEAVEQLVRATLLLADVAGIAVVR